MDLGKDANALPTGFQIGRSTRCVGSVEGERIEEHWTASEAIGSLAALSIGRQQACREIFA